MPLSEEPPQLYGVPTTERAASTIELLELEEEEVETEAPPVETPAPLRAPRVFGPTTPSTRRPLEDW